MSGNTKNIVLYLWHARFWNAKPYEISAMRVGAYLRKYCEKLREDGRFVAARLMLARWWIASHRGREVVEFGQSFISADSRRLWWKFRGGKR